MIVEVIFMAEEVSSKIGQEQKRYYIRQRAVPNFPLEFVEPRKHIANAGARKPRQGKTREARKIGTEDNLLFRIKPPTFIARAPYRSINCLNFH